MPKYEYQQAIIVSQRFKRLRLPSKTPLCSIRCIFITLYLKISEIECHTTHKALQGRAASHGPRDLFECSKQLFAKPLHIANGFKIPHKTQMFTGWQRGDLCVILSAVHVSKKHSAYIEIKYAICVVYKSIYYIIILCEQISIYFTRCQFRAFSPIYIYILLKYNTSYLYIYI